MYVSADKVRIAKEILEETPSRKLRTGKLFERAVRQRPSLVGTSYRSSKANFHTALRKSGQFDTAQHGIVALKDTSVRPQSEAGEILRLALLIGPEEFGADYPRVAARLTAKLGMEWDLFFATAKANASWVRYDYLETFVLYTQAGCLPETDRRVKELANLLERTPASISLRLANFAYCDPQHDGKGLSGGAGQCESFFPKA